MPPAVADKNAVASSSEGDTTAIVASKVTMEPRLPRIVSDHVHASRMGPALDRAVERLVTPFVDVSGQGRDPLLQAVHLAANVHVEGKAGTPVSGTPTSGTATGSATAEDGGMLSGYVAVAEGEAPVAPLLEGDRLGTGATWLRLKDVDRTAVVKEFAGRAGFRLAEALPGGRVSVVRGQGDDLEDVYYLVTEGNDRTAAARLRAAVQARAGAPATVRDLMKTDPELRGLYTGLMKTSRDVRLAAATRFAAAHSLSLDPSFPAGDQDTHFIQHRQWAAPIAASLTLGPFPLASPIQSERSGSALRANHDVYLVYDNVVDTNEAHSGVMLFKGPMSGYTLISGRKHTVQTRESYAWSNASRERRFSMFPADTGRWLGRASGRVPDRHVNSSPALAKAGAERMKWQGDVSSWNPHAEAIYHAPTDAR